MIVSGVPMAEAMRRLGKSRATLKSWRRLGKLDGVCVEGRVWLFSEESIERMAASVEEAAANPPRPFGRQPQKI